DNDNYDDGDDVDEDDNEKDDDGGNDDADNDYDDDNDEEDINKDDNVDDNRDDNDDDGDDDFDDDGGNFEEEIKNRMLMMILRQCVHSANTTHAPSSWDDQHNTTTKIEDDSDDHKSYDKCYADCLKNSDE
ncbi:hypothetical protein ElyMa_000375400, partial [Elysia marginata]